MPNGLKQNPVITSFPDASSQNYLHLPPSAPRQPGRGRKVVLVVIAVIVVLLGATVALARFGMLPFDVPFIASARTELLTKMLESANQLGDSSFKNTIAITAKPRSDLPTPLSLEEYSKALSGTANETSTFSQDDAQQFLQFLPASVAMSLSLNGTSQAPEADPRNSEFELTGAYATDEVDYGLTLLGRQVDGTLYLNLQRLSLGDLLAPFGLDTSTIVNQWFKVETEALQSFGASFGLSPENLSEKNQQAQLVEQLTTALPIIDQQRFINIKKLGREELAGASGGFDHFRFTIDWARSAEVYKAVTEALSATHGDKALLTFDQETYDRLARQEFRNLAPKIKEALLLDVWVDPQTSLPVQTEVRLYLVPNGDQAFVEFLYELRATWTVMPLDTPPVIVTPDDALPFATLFGLLTPGLDLTSSQAVARDAQRAADAAQLLTALTLYFDDHHSFPPSGGRVLTAEELSAYLPVIPTPPPSESETCSEQNNQYIYTAFSDRYYQQVCASERETCTGYTITYCLESEQIAGATGRYAIASGGFAGSLEHDGDTDGLNEFFEEVYRTNDTKADSDGDGFSDKTEIENGFNPAGPGELPQ